MKDNRRLALLLIGAAVLAVLALPAAFKDRNLPDLVGPDLSDLAYSVVSFENPHAGLQLGGMLFLPDGPGPFPAAVIIQGSGSSRRNNVWYLSVVARLQRSGIAVLVPDKRGSEQSEGDWVGADFGELATDTLAAIEFLRGQTSFEPSAIGLIGMSQGGWIAPVVASQSDAISFVVNMVGSAVTVDEQLLHEEIFNIAHYTYLPVARLIAPLTTARLKRMPQVSAFVGFDPIPYWKQVGVPVFVAYGGNDENVPVDASIARLGQSGLDAFKVKVYADGGHAIRDRATNRVSAEYLDDLVEFIRDSVHRTHRVGI